MAIQNLVYAQKGWNGFSNTCTLLLMAALFTPAKSNKFPSTMNGLTKCGIPTQRNIIQP